MAINMGPGRHRYYLYYKIAIREQKREVGRVKRYEKGIATDPKTFSPQHTVRDALEVKDQYGLMGTNCNLVRRLGTLFHGTQKNRLRNAAVDSGIPESL